MYILYDVHLLSSQIVDVIFHLTFRYIQNNEIYKMYE